MITHLSTIDSFCRDPLPILRMMNFHLSVLKRMKSPLCPNQLLHSPLDLPLFFNWATAPEGAIDIRFTDFLGGAFVFTDGHNTISTPLGYPDKLELEIDITEMLVVSLNPKLYPLPSWVLTA